MYKYVRWLFTLSLLLSTVALGQESELRLELERELTELKVRLAHAQALLNELELREFHTDEAQEDAEPAPAINTPSALPLSPEGYEKDTPRFDILLQSRGDFFWDEDKNSTFFLRKAELGIKGHAAEHVDFSIEIDPVNPDDPLRRTYIRLSHLSWLHIKFGMEKAPIGLEELTSTAQIPFVDRSEVSDRFAAAEEVGVHLESRWTQWLLQFAVTNGGRRLLRDNNDHKDVSARMVWAPNHWLSMGGATLLGRTGVDELERDRYNFEFKLGSNLSGFQSEFYRARDDDVWSSAFYGAGYWAVPVQSRWLTHLQPVVRYEYIDRDDGNRLEELSLLTFGVSLMLDEHRSKFQINFLKDLKTGTRNDELRVQYQVEL